MEQIEFQIKSMPEYTFRTMKINAMEINAIASTCDLDDINKTLKTYDYCLSHIEVKLQNTWTQVKQKQDFWPASLENDVIAIRELTEWYLDNVVFKAFLKSSE